MILEIDYLLRKYTLSNRDDFLYFFGQSVIPISKHWKKISVHGIIPPNLATWPNQKKVVLLKTNSVISINYRSHCVLRKKIFESFCCPLNWKIHDICLCDYHEWVFETIQGSHRRLVSTPFRTGKLARSSLPGRVRRSAPALRRHDTYAMLCRQKTMISYSPAILNLQMEVSWNGLPPVLIHSKHL